MKLEKFARYPIRDDQVLPTRFGNAIRSFETYGKTRFNLDSQTLWHELCSVAPKYIQKIDSAKSSVDFFVALIYLSAAFGLATIIIAIYQGFDYSVLILCIPAFIVTLLSHWVAIRATDAWSYAIQALVNIGRVKLADNLGLQIPERLEEEKAMWGFVTTYVFFARTEDGAQLDRFRKKPETRARSANVEHPALDAQNEDANQREEEPEDDDNLMET